MNIFGKINNEKARKQLNLPHDYEIFIMATEIDYLKDDFSYKVHDLYSEIGYLSSDDVNSIFKEINISIKLPQNYILVGMINKNNNSEVYGIIEV